MKTLFRSSIAVEVPATRYCIHNQPPPNLTSLFHQFEPNNVATISCIPLPASNSNLITADYLIRCRVALFDQLIIRPSFCLGP
jgi:hypothetical protein